jgi:hypothetical protein
MFGPSKRRQDNGAPSILRKQVSFAPPEIAKPPLRNMFAEFVL